VLGNSKTIVYIEAVADWIKGFMPDNSEEKAQESVSSGLRELKSGAEEKIGEPIRDKAAEYNEQVRDKMNELIENQHIEERTPPNE